MSARVRSLTSTLKSISRGISTTRPLNDARSLAKMKKRQADFQCEDGRPIFLKGGFCDRLLYGGTLLATVSGLFLTLMTVYDFAKPSSWKKPC